ncbi:DUF4153 domain-containing protein [Pseudonocardia sp. MH-G8]|uniref:DUF4153 domain-containing protein n=1 Tax=Pseudonocardia sp. MH-G8 TaxID=1854588 RepID=UPI000BD41046|nr:DUF4173 domain-containing protein [Pseudonocardia sp. MH-G8]OZM83339.1 hypothetical protein CFP66_02025 [Pseudonocardia sp. MH-G8]
MLKPGAKPITGPGAVSTVEPVAESGGTAVAVATPAQALPALPVRGTDFFPGWRGPAVPPSWPVFGAAAAVGATVAVAVPLGRPGLGWFVCAVVGAVAVVAVGRHVRRGAPDRPAWRADTVDAAWGLAAVGLAGVAAVRDAPWLVALCLLAALAAASIAIAGRHFRSIAFAAIAVALAAVRALPWAGRALREARRSAGSARTVISALVGLCLLAVFGPLLASADPAFGRLLDDLLPTVDAAHLIRWAVLFALGAGALLGAGFLLLGPPAPPTAHPAAPLPLRRVEWALPIGLLVGLFALFVGVQFATLFGSDAHVVATTGLTYAEYARSGFWQLLAVTVLALGVVLLASRFAPAPSAADRAWKRGLLGALTALTLVIVASALSRMWLYQEAYGFTTLRLLVLACELWLGACFLLVLVAVVRLHAKPLVREMAAAGLVALLALAVLNPDRFIAAHNVTRHALTGELDQIYLATLSADAVPALLELPQPQRCDTLTRIATRLAEPDADWTSWNAARAAARDALADVRC